MVCIKKAKCMKRKNWLLLLLILLCLGVLLGYRAYDGLRTDTRAPEIRMDGSVPEVSVQDPRSALLQGVTARDKKDGDVTASLVVEKIALLDGGGTISVTYAAFDRAGNVAKAERQARFTDYKSPRLTLEAPLAYTFGSNFDLMANVGAQDVIDGDIQHRVRATSLDEISVTELGTHYVRFHVSNSLGDSVTRILPVEVYEAGTYEARLALTDYLVYLEAGSGFDPRHYLESFTLKGAETDLTGGLPADFALETSGNVQTQVPGVYSVEYRVIFTDRHDTNPDYDAQYTGYSKLMVVVEG